MLFHFDLNSQMLEYKISQQHNKHKISLLKLLQTFLKQISIELLYYVDIDHDKVMLEQIESTNIENNLDKEICFSKFWVLK